MINDLLSTLAKEEFAILSVQNIGAYSSGIESVCEIAIQIVNWNGELLDSFESLICPPNLKINNDDNILYLKQAPSLDLLLPNIVSFLKGKTPVMHDLSCLDKFINANNECKSICTLDLFNNISENLGIYKLQHIFAYYDIDLPHEQTAKSKVIALSKLFSLLKNLYTNIESINKFQSEYISHFNCTFNYGELAYILKRGHLDVPNAKNSDNFNKLLNRLTSQSDNSLSILKYLNVLDRALEDRIITEYEAISLYNIAEDLNLSKDQVINIHEEYLRKLTRIYLIDEFLSEIEIKDLNIVSDLLFVSNNKLDQLIIFERSNIQVSTPPCLNQLKTLIEKNVCFAGHLKCKINGKKINSDLAIQLVKERGLFVKKTISKNVDYLIASDIDNTKMRKAKLAAQYNIIIIQESIFWEMIGVKTDDIRCSSNNC